MNLAQLECRLDYGIKCHAQAITESVKMRNYTDLWGTIWQRTKLMRQWVRLYAITNKYQIKTIASDYFESKGLELSTWLMGVKEGRKGDVLILFILSVITGVHCCVHLKRHNYWTTLKKHPLCTLSTCKGVIFTWHMSDKESLSNYIKDNTSQLQTVWC